MKRVGAFPAVASAASLPMCRGLVATVLMLVSIATRADMLPLSPEEMTSVTGQEGISLEFDLRINSDAAGAPDPVICPVAGSRVQCRMAIKFANREGQGGSGLSEWLVLKGFSGRIYLPRFNLNAGTSSASPTPYAQTTGLTSRFINGLGVNVSPYSKPYLEMTIPEEIQFYRYQIAGMAIEYGTGLTAGTGFQADPTDTRSFIGLLISNSISPQPATVRVDGAISIFGF